MPCHSNAERAALVSSTRRTSQLGAVGVDLRLDFLGGHGRQGLRRQLLAYCTKTLDALGAQRLAQQPPQRLWRKQPRGARFLRKRFRKIHFKRRHGRASWLQREP